ncbi:MAG TPA: Panacea domain-containing protein [Candidatus Paceibacterota bacterium]
MAHTTRNMTVPALNRDKYTQALLYFITECGNEHLGITKLNKLFYYLDFISYRDRGESVTGETYIRLPKGPLARSLEEKILEPAQVKKLIERKQEKSGRYGVRNRFHALAKYDLSVFDDYECDLLRKLCAEFKEWNTDQMIAQTHSEAPWVFSKANQPLDYREADDIELFAGRSITA